LTGRPVTGAARAGEPAGFDGPADLGEVAGRPATTSTVEVPMTLDPTHRPIVCVGAKGGQGTTTIAAAIAVRSATRRPTLLIDTAGDTLAAVGHPDTPAHDTLDAAVSHSVVILHQLDVAVTTGPLDPATVARLASDGWQVVIDAGTGPVELDALRLLVVRNCYLALRRAVTLTADRVVLVTEPHRALGRADVAAVLGFPVTEVPWDPAVARVVDAGLLATRLPRTLTHAVDRLDPTGVTR
jgi:hypothetical protein